jgi:hypothetical protein
MSEFEVALSFAGEDRAYVEMVADELKGRGVKVFYDKYYQIDLWGKDLYVHLIEVYKKKAGFVVLFISQHYAQKLWSNHERQAAQARAFSESREYILPARFDSTEIPGLLPTTGYLDLKKFSAVELAILICEKIGRSESSAKASVIPSPRSPALTGRVRFNYANNNHRFRIGEGLYEFETQWSKGDSRCIYCYNDQDSIRGVALAPRGVQLSDLTNAGALDFSSRSRCPEIARLVILENNNGFYAAIKILEIQDDSRGDPEDLLAFQYWILKEGGDNFSVIDE